MHITLSDCCMKNKNVTRNSYPLLQTKYQLSTSTGQRNMIHTISVCTAELRLTHFYVRCSLGRFSAVLLLVDCTHSLKVDLC